MLLEDDGLDKNWEEGTKSDWEGDLGLHDRDDSSLFGVPRDYDSSAQGGGYTQTLPEPGQAMSLLVRHMPLPSFRQRLIAHFNSRWRAQKVVWPSRNGTRWVPSVQMRAQALEMGILF